MITWAERVANLAKELGREPTLDELTAEHFLAYAAEVEADRQELRRWKNGGQRSDESI